MLTSWIMLATHIRDTSPNESVPNRHRESPLFATTNSVAAARFGPAGTLSACVTIPSGRTPPPPPLPPRLVGRRRRPEELPVVLPFTVVEGVVEPQVHDRVNAVG